jgi:c-di-GMP-binding flagellar brake protein YcgR
MSTPSNSMSDLAILGCDATLESKNASSTGKLTFIEGDITEITVRNSNAYILGDAVKLVVYSPDGVLAMETSVVAREKESVYVITPHQLLTIYLKRRKQPRVNVKTKGKVLEILGREQFEEPIEVTVSNIALGGIGFVAVYPFSEQQVITLDWNMEESIVCQVKVVHTRSTNNGRYFGAEFEHFPKPKVNLLRAYILRKQIENRQLER